MKAIQFDQLNPLDAPNQEMTGFTRIKGSWARRYDAYFEQMAFDQAKEEFWNLIFERLGNFNAAGGSGQNFWVHIGAATPESVTRYFQESWGSQASNISSIEVNGGFNVTYTATQSGNIYTFFQSREWIQGQLNFLAAFDGLDIPSEQRSLKEKIEIGIESFGLSLELNEKAFTSLQKLANQSSGTSYPIQQISKYKAIGRTMKFVNILGATFTVSDIIEDGPNANNLTDLGMEGVGIFVPGFGWALSAAYFLGKLFGLDEAMDKAVRECIYKTILKSQLQ